MCSLVSCWALGRLVVCPVQVGWSGVMLCLVVGEAQLFQPLVEIGQASTVAGHLQATAVASAGRMRATRIENGMAGFHALQEQCITNTNRSPYWLLCCESIVRSSFVILNLCDLSQFAEQLLL